MVAIPRPGGWTLGTVTETKAETPTGRSIWLDVPEWPGNIAGQHVDVRLTAADGYQATRSFSLASCGPEPRVQLAVDRLPGGEVSPYLVDDLLSGDRLELRGPLGGWFVWQPDDPRPVQLIGGGSGVVPLAAMLRSRAASGSSAPFRLLYSVRSLGDRFFGDELDALESRAGLAVDYLFTRATPAGWPRPAGRVTTELLAQLTMPAAHEPAVFVCGPTGFVELVAAALVTLGHDPARVKTERFGGA